MPSRDSESEGQPVGVEVERLEDVIRRHRDREAFLRSRIDQLTAALTDAASCGCPVVEGLEDEGPYAINVSPRVVHRCNRNPARELVLGLLLLRHGTGLLQPSRLTSSRTPGALR